MSGIEKVIWVVNYESLQDFLKQAVSVKATAVAIRTDNDLLKAVPAFHDKEIKVYGWRWPSAKQDAAMKEANKAADLLTKGLDGYFVDPEGAKGKPYDWDPNGLDQLAVKFCKKVKSASSGKPFGIASHYRGKYRHRKLPWASFFKYCNLFLPQAYWRSDFGVIGHGMPDDNQKVGKPPALPGRLAKV